MLESVGWVVVDQETKRVVHSSGIADPGTDIRKMLIRYWPAVLRRALTRDEGPARMQTWAGPVDVFAAPRVSYKRLGAATLVEFAGGEQLELHPIRTTRRADAYLAVYSDREPELRGDLDGIRQLAELFAEGPLVEGVATAAQMAALQRWTEQYRTLSAALDRLPPADIWEIGRICRHETHRRAVAFAAALARPQ